jgi:hypothetical protein
LLFSRGSAAIQSSETVRRAAAAFRLSRPNTLPPSGEGIIPPVFARGVFLTLVEADRYTARGSSNGRNCRRPAYRKECDPLEFEPLDQFQQRRKKLSEIEALGHSAYPRKFAWTHTARQIGEQSAWPDELSRYARTEKRLLRI